MGRLKSPKPQLAPAPLAAPPPVGRGRTAQRGYNSRWNRMSRDFKRQHPLCLGCQAVGRTRQTEVTDHIVPHRGNQRLLWDRANWQPACRLHHDQVKQRLEILFDAGQLEEADLRLDSAAAIAMTLRVEP